MKPMLRSRREFLRTGALGGALGWTVPTFLAETWRAMALAADGALVQPVTGRDGTVLVVLQLAGGNDGLNTVVPHGRDEYRRARGALALPSADVLRIDDEFGWHPALKGLRSLHDAGRAAIIHGVGYPNPNRSHFRSMEIWHTASDADRVVREGWLGRYFDAACRGADPTVGVSLGRQMPQAFTARKPTGIALEAAGGRLAGRGSRGGKEGTPGGADAMGGGVESVAGEMSGGSVEGLSGSGVAGGGSVLDFLDRTALDAQVSSAKVREITGRSRNAVEYPGTRLGQSLKLVAQLIGGGLPTRVYYVSHGGFDTHTGQLGTHARLLGEFGDAVLAFQDDLKAQGQSSRVLTLIFSEFGRRVAANASGGTDHGAAGPMVVLGEGLKAPMFGRHPGLRTEELVNGDLRFGVDFRSVYAGALEGWLGAASEPVLGRRFEPLVLAQRKA